MSRDTNGNYTLPIGNPVVTGTLITTAWANSTLADLAAAMTDSLSRSGQGGMLAALRGVDGSAATPSFSFTNDQTLGLFRPLTGTLGFSAGGVERVRLHPTGRLSVGGWATSPIAGALTVARNIDTDADSAIALGGVVQVGAPTLVFGARSAIGMAATSSVTALAHYTAAQGTFGSGSSANVQAGFVADTSLVGGVSNYGFRGRLPLAAGRFNLFMDGTAPNYLAGDLRIGASTARGAGQGLLVEGLSASASNALVLRNTFDAQGPTLGIAKTRAGAVSGNAIVQVGDTLGALQFQGDDGVALVGGADIVAQVDSAPSVNIMPARLLMRTAGASGVLTERARIDGTGLRVGAGTDLANAGYVSFQPSFRNRLHNPFGVINQRAAASYTVTGGGQWTLDRWYAECSGARSFTVAQSTDAPPGAPGSISVTTVGAGAPGAADIAWIGQGIEGFNIADFRWGTPDAQPVTLGFWFRSAVAGAYSSFIMQGSLTRSYVMPFTVNAPNTWEFKTVTVPAETGATWSNANAVGLYFGIDLGSGSNLNTSSPLTWDVGRRQRTSGSLNFLGATSNLRFTAPQIERGTVPTSCERREYTVELALCQRYYYRRTAGSTVNERLSASGLTVAPVASQGYFLFPVPMRATPSVVNVGNVSNIAIYDGSAVYPVSAWSLDALGPDGGNLSFTHSTGGIVGRSCHVTRNGVASPAPFAEFSSDI